MHGSGWMCCSTYTSIRLFSGVIAMRVLQKLRMGSFSFTRTWVAVWECMTEFADFLDGTVDHNSKKETTMKEALGTHDTIDDSEASVGKRVGLTSTGGQSAGSALESK